MILTPVIMPVCQDAAVRTPARVIAQRYASRQALEACAVRCGAPTSRWEKNDRDVPKPNKGYFWSVSHKRNWAAAVIAPCAVGIDVEQLLPRDDQAVFDEVANQREWEVLGGRSWDNFFRIWTAKEATLKAHGQGIGALSSCQVHELEDDMHTTLRFAGVDWLVEHYYHDNHIFTVTAVGDEIRWLVKSMDDDSIVRDKS